MTITGFVVGIEEEEEEDKPEEDEVVVVVEEEGAEECFVMVMVSLRPVPPLFPPFVVPLVNP